MLARGGLLVLENGTQGHDEVVEGERFVGPPGQTDEDHHVVGGGIVHEGIGPGDAGPVWLASGVALSERFQDLSPGARRERERYGSARVDVAGSEPTEAGEQQRSKCIAAVHS